MEKDKIKEKIKKVLMELHMLLGSLEDDIEEIRPITTNNVIMFPKNKISHKTNNNKEMGIVIPFPNKSTNFNSTATLNNKEQDELKYKNISIIKHKTCNTWYCRPRDNGGKQVYISAKTQKECYDKLKSFINKETKQNKVILYTFETWQKQWLETYKINKVRNTTIKKYEYMNKHLQSLNKSYMTKIQSLDIINILNNIEQTRARQQVYDYLKDIFTRAYENEIIPKNIFINIQKPKHIKISEKKALTKEEETTFINACKNDIDGKYFLIGLFQGLRPGETLALTPEDFDFKNKTLRINKSENKGNNKTKNESSNRIMPLFDKTIEITKNFITLPKNERIFKKGYDSYREKLQKVLKNINIRTITLHELRHTFITRCKELQIQEEVIQNWVGHEQGSKITAKVYTHINNEQNIKYINIFNDNQ